MRTHFLLVLLISCPIWLFGQYGAKLSGKVVFQGEPVPGATLRILNLDLGTASDENGAFSFENLPEGIHKLEVRSIGFSTIVQQVEIGVKDINGLNFDLKESSLGLKEVVVTGTMNSEYVANSPVKVEVVTSKQFQTYLPSGGSNLVEGLTLINGVQEEVACGVCFTNSISINGLPGQYSSVLMDGTPMFGNLASVYGLNGIPNMMIERIELIKGPNSTLYGSEAVAGVINVITKDPEKQALASADIMVSSHQEVFTNLAISTKVGRTRGMIGLNHGAINLFEDRNSDGFGDIINMDRYSIFTKWKISRPSNKMFTITGKVYYEDRRNGVNEFIKNRNYKTLRGDSSIYGESIYTQRAEIFGTYHFNSKENFRIDYSLSHHDQDSYYGSGHYLAKQNIAFSNFIWSKDLSRHNLTSGLTFRLQLYEDNTAATETIGSNSEISNQPDNQFIPGLFIQDEWKASPKTTLLAGARVDHYEYHGIIISPRLSGKYLVGKWTNVRMNFGTGFRVVNLFTEDHAFITGQREVEIREDLNPERSYNLSANLNHVFVMGGSQGMFDLDGFYTYFTNKILPDYSDQNKIIYENTNGYAQTMGIGAKWIQEFRFPLSISLGLTVMDSREFEEKNSHSLESRAVEFAPRYSGVITASYQFRKIGLLLAYNSNITGPMALPEVYDLDQNGNALPYSRPITSTPFSVHNLKVEKALGKQFHVYGGIQNLFDYYQSVSPLVGYNDPNYSTGFSPNFDTSYSFSPIHGREYYLGIRLSLGG